MSRQQNPEPTAVDDVRRVREKIARQNGGDLREHIAETNRIGDALRDKLNVKLVPAPGGPTRRSGTEE